MRHDIKLLKVAFFIDCKIQYIQRLKQNTTISQTISRTFGQLKCFMKRINTLPKRIDIKSTGQFFIKKQADRMAACRTHTETMCIDARRRMKHPLKMQCPMKEPENEMNQIEPARLA